MLACTVPWQYGRELSGVSRLDTSYSGIDVSWHGGCNLFLWEEEIGFFAYSLRSVSGWQEGNPVDVLCTDSQDPWESVRVYTLQQLSACLRDN